MNAFSRRSSATGTAAIYETDEQFCTSSITTHFQDADIPHSETRNNFTNPQPIVAEQEESQSTIIGMQNQEDNFCRYLNSKKGPLDEEHRGSVDAVEVDSQIKLSVPNSEVKEHQDASSTKLDSAFTGASKSKNGTGAVSTTPFGNFACYTHKVAVGIVDEPAMPTGIFARMMGFQTPTYYCRGANLNDNHPTREPTEPGAHAIPAAPPALNLQQQINAIELVGQPQQEEESSQHTVNQCTEAGLVEATPVCLPVATPHDQDTMGTKGNKLQWSKRGKVRLGICLLVVLVALYGIVAMASMMDLGLFRTDPTKLHHMYVKANIELAFGKDYFDNEQKKKALHWIAHEDPIQALAFQQDKQPHVNPLIQRFALVALYFQTSSQQPWNYCNPPEVGESDMCYFDMFTGKGRPTESRGTRWLSAAHECQWMGVYCDGGSKTVSAINIRQNNMTGYLPSELSKLGNIRELTLSENRFSGSLPLWIVQLTYIERLDLSGNLLTGMIPPNYFLSPSLMTILLHSNLLTGTIPPQIGSFNGTSFLALSSNPFIGSIPQEIYSLVNLQGLWLDNNQLSGTLSTKLGELTSMAWLNLGGSPGVHGLLPSEIGLLTKLSILYIRKAQLSGRIPEELYLKSLEEVDFSSNGFSGTISSRLGLVPDLRFFDVTDNNISGTLPSEISMLKGLSELDVSGNPKLGGSMPANLCSHRNQLLKIAADCTPVASTGLPTVFCPAGCCHICCDVETKICIEN